MLNKEFFKNMIELNQQIVSDIIMKGTVVLFVLVAAFILYKVAARISRKMTQKGLLPEQITRGFLIFMKYFLLFSALIIILGVFGVGLGSLLSFLTALTAMIAIGFVAVWSIVSNVLCALLIVSVKPFNIGDRVEVLDSGPGISGKVSDINFLYTTIEQGPVEMGGDIRPSMINIPNNYFFQKAVKVDKKERENSKEEWLGFKLFNGK